MPATGQASEVQFIWEPADRASATATLVQQLSLHRDSKRRRRLTYLDTFDWRVHRAGFLLTRSDDGFELVDRHTGALVGKAPGAEDGGLPPAFSDRLASAVAPRALMAVAAVASTEVLLSARNGEDKTVAKVRLSESQVDRDGAPVRLAPRLSVQPLRGYDRQAARLTEQLAELPGVEPAAGSLFAEAVAVGGRHPGDYTGKLALHLSRDESNYDAARLIYRTLLTTMRRNEHGVLDDIDSEFLHDYRVAVRRIRSALKELPGALPEAYEQRLREEFRWLGQVTTPTRDLDVYLLEFPAFRALVGDAADDLEPLRRVIAAGQRRAHTEQRKALRSARYRKLVDGLAAAVDAHAPVVGSGPAGNAPIGRTADTRIAKVASRVLREGRAIDDSSAPERLHDLRKRCKELRYLLEFFASLYDPRQHGALVSALKGLQDNLGQFQDTQVQRQAMEGFADRLLISGDTSAAALLAVGRLMASFDDREQSARAEFAQRFASFASDSNRRRLQRLTEASP